MAINISRPEAKRILLLNPPGTQYYVRDKYCTSISVGKYYWPQIDLLVLSGRLKADYEVTILDAVIERRTPASLLFELVQRDYRAIFFLTSLASYSEDFAFIKAVKERCPATQTIGIGGLLLMQGEAIMQRQPYLDAVLLDFTSERILDYLAGERGLADMITRVDGEIVRGEINRNAMFSYPLPLHEQIGRGRYLMPVVPAPKFSVTIASTGCPYHCDFCVNSNIPFRVRNEENLLAELHELQQSGFTHVIFHDPTFTVDRAYVLQLCRAMIEQGIRLKWACQTRINRVDDELLALMKRAGCQSIEYGAESGDDGMLAAMNKGITVAQIRETLTATHRHGISTVCFFLIGMAGETEETIRRTIDLAIECDCDYASFSLPLPHPGTKLEEKLDRHEGKVVGNGLGGQMPALRWKMPTLAPEKIYHYRAIAYRRFYLRPAYIWKRIRKTQSLYELWIQIRLSLGILKKIIKL